MKKGFFVVCVLLVICLFMAGCNKKEVKENVSGTGTSDTGAAAEKLEITDMTGRKIVLDKYPEKIVSLSPTNTEILFEVGAGNKVVGVTSYCDYPEEAKTREKIGSFSKPNVELIKKIQPDVILAGSAKLDDFIKVMEELKIPVIQTEAENFDEIYDSIKLIGKITANEKKADQVVEETRKKVDAVKEKVKNASRPKVFYVVWMDPLTTAGEETFINDVIRIAGGVNAAAGIKGWAKYSPEKLLQDNPDIIISAKHSTNDGIGKEQIASNKIFSNLSSVKNGNIHIMSDDNIISRATPRIVSAVEELAKVLHPELK